MFPVRAKGDSQHTRNGSGRRQDSFALDDHENLFHAELEHERNRLNEELKRLQKRADDTQRSLEIIKFMETHIESDPLLNPTIRMNQIQKSPNNKSVNFAKDIGHVLYSNRNNNHSQNHNNNNHNDQRISQSLVSHAHSSNNNNNNNKRSNFLSPNLEYLPQNTLIRMANKQVKKIKNLQIGDKILSLCINTYPNSSTRPLRAHTPQGTQHNNGQNNNNSNHSNHSNHNNNQNNNKTHNVRRSRKRSKTTVNQTIPFMLPPPPKSVNTYMDDDDVHSMQQKYHTKQDSMPRQSMPFLPLQARSSNESGGGDDVLDIRREDLFEFDVLKPQRSKTIHISSNNSNKKQNIRSMSFVENGNTIGNSNAIRSMHMNHQTMHLNHQNNKEKAIQHSKSMQNHLNPISRQNRAISYHTQISDRMSRSTNSSPRFGAQNRNQKMHSNHASQMNGKLNNNNIAMGRLKLVRSQSKHDRSQTAQLSSKIQNGKTGNYLESVIVTNVYSIEMSALIEIITENSFKIRCSPTHLFWIIGKGWGCVDVYKKRKLTNANYAIFKLKKGEQLLTATGKKYAVCDIKSVDKPNGVSVFSLIVNKNHCFFANDLLVRNSM